MASEKPQKRVLSEEKYAALARMSKTSGVVRHAAEQYLLRGLCASSDKGITDFVLVGPKPH